MRLDPQPGELLDRSRSLTFRFGSQVVPAFEGDTFGSALYASGRRIFSRSFKYHRPRGLLCCAGHCANCLMTVDGVPNVRVCVEPVRAGAVVAGQNALGSIDRDLLSVVDKLGGPFTPVGFYYRTMIRPRWAWPLYEKGLRRIAGLGEVGGEQRRYDKEHRRARVLVIGGGRSGRRAALAAAAEGQGVVLVDESARTRACLAAQALPGPEPAAFEALAAAGVNVVHGRAVGLYEGGLVPVETGTLLLRYRAARIVVATGTLEQPLVFPGNDLVGVLLPGAVQRLVDDWALKPGERAVVLGAEDSVAALERAGVEIAEVADPAAVRSITARGSKGRLARVELDGKPIACDLAVVSGGRQPAYSLLAQSGAPVEYDASSRVFVPRELPAGIEAVGSVLAGGSTAAPSYRGEDAKGRCFVCVCEDVTEKDVERAIREGFDSIELSKRYTTVTMGPCQGKFCQLGSIRLHAAKTGAGEAAIGTTTARPPWAPVELGLLAGRHHDPMRRTSLHQRHEETGAEMVWAGPWQRPHSYGDPTAEIAAVHADLGVIDVSTLGKLLVEGPDAAAFLERLYPNRFADLAQGRVRYTVLGSDAGRILDDGTVARLGPELFYVTTTSTGADAVHEWFDWWNAGWGYDVDVVNVTGALSALNLAGPRAREALGTLTDADVSAEAFRYLDARQLEVAGVRALALRIGFVGELGYELHFASPAGEHVWDALVAAGARPFGLEPQRVLRLEKQHVIVGQDTDTESNLLGAGLDWLPKLDRGDFVGKWALEQALVRERLVGFRMDVLPLEGAQVVRDGRSVGRVTSARASEAAGGVIGLAWVSPELAVEDAELHVRVGGAQHPGRVSLRPFLDPDGEKVRA